MVADAKERRGEGERVDGNEGEGRLGFRQTNIIIGWIMGLGNWIGSWASGWAYGSFIKYFVNY